MGVFRSHTSHPTSSPSSKSTNDYKELDKGGTRSQTGHLSSHFHKSSSSKNFKETVPEMGVLRSCTDPLDRKTSNEGSLHSGSSSGTSSPKRISASMEVARGIYERSSSVIPGYYLLAGHYHKYKMRHCQGMDATDEEAAGIKKMQGWNWKHATHPGEAPPPIGPKNESWHFEGVALEQILSGHTKIMEEEEDVKGMKDLNLKAA